MQTKRDTTRLHPYACLVAGLAVAVLSFRICVWINARYAALEWREYSELSLIEALQAEETVLVLFYSPESVFSREFERRVFGDPFVREAVRHRDVVLMRANVDHSAGEEALERDVMDPGVPAIAVYRGQRGSKPRVVLRRDDITAVRVIEAIQ